MIWYLKYNKTDYNDSFGEHQGILNVDRLVQDFVSRVFNSIDEELYDLESMVEDGEYATNKIIFKIKDIRKKYTNDIKI